MQTDTVHKQLEQFIRAGLSFEEAVSALENLGLSDPELASSVEGLTSLKGRRSALPLLPVPRVKLRQLPPEPVRRAPAVWLAFRAMLLCVGGVISAGYVASLPWIIRIADLGFAGLTWLLIYKMIRSYEAIHGQYPEAK